MSRCYCEKQVTPLSRLDKRSLRWVTSGRGRVLVGCPRGKFQRGRCGVGLRAYKVLGPAKKRCKRGSRRICK